MAKPSTLPVDDEPAVPAPEPSAKPPSTRRSGLGKLVTRRAWRPFVRLASLCVFFALVPIGLIAAGLLDVSALVILWLLLNVGIAGAIWSPLGKVAVDLREDGFVLHRWGKPRSVAWSDVSSHTDVSKVWGPFRRRSLRIETRSGPIVIPAILVNNEITDALRQGLDQHAPSSAPPATRWRRIQLVRRADGGFFYWLAKLYGFAALVLLAAIPPSLLAIYNGFAKDTPPPPDLTHYASVSPAISRIYAADGTLLGEFAREWRRVAAYDEMPESLINAFLAVEDHEFFDHGGIYVKGIARAAWKNVTAGDFAQGGSTITQQVAKQFLGAEKSLERKAREAIMARRLESMYSKKAILSLYLNHIFLGAGAYGVAAAAERYFQKDLSELTIAESALIAGLAQAPSRYSPMRHPERAIERRNVVLDQMEKYGFATPEEIAAAKAEPLTLHEYKDVFPDRMPYYAEHVRRMVSDDPDLKARYGDDPLMTGGLRVEAAGEPVFEAAAYENVDYLAHKQDKRQGWRGPEWYLDDPAQRQTFVDRQKALYGAGPLEPDRRYLGLVEKVDSSGAKVRVGDRELELPIRNMRWASTWRAGSEVPNDDTISNATRALKVGDVIWVKRELRTRGKFREWKLNTGMNPLWERPDDERDWDEGHPDVVALEQTPHPQAVLFNGDHRTGYVPAMVGGNDFSRSVLNRATQSCRTPASAFKPIYYSKALEDGYGYDTVLYDQRVTLRDEETGQEWTPKNLYDDLDGTVSLEYALVFSKNIPSIDLFNNFGDAKLDGKARDRSAAEEVIEWAKGTLGFTNGTNGVPDFNVDASLALGSSCTILADLVRAFAIFARGGEFLDWVYIRRILDRDGNIVQDHTKPFDPMLPPGDRLDRVAVTAGIEPRQVMKPRTAFLTQKLLGKMVEHGLTKTVRETELNAAGKTGTSDWTYDVQFLAFTSRFITLVWAGDDNRVRTLGREDAAYITIVPLWARYMYEVAGRFPNEPIPWKVPPGVDPKDRGEHSRGQKGHQMSLVRHYEKNQMERDGYAAPEGEGGGAEGGAPAPPGT